MILSRVRSISHSTAENRSLLIVIFNRVRSQPHSTAEYRRLLIVIMSYRHEASVLSTFGFYRVLCHIQAITTSRNKLISRDVLSANYGSNQHSSGTYSRRENSNQPIRNEQQAATNEQTKQVGSTMTA